MDTLIGFKGFVSINKLQVFFHSQKKKESCLQYSTPQSNAR